MSKIIIIPAQISQGEEEDGPTSCCRQSYIDSIMQAGGLPLILPVGLERQEILKAFEYADGILLQAAAMLTLLYIMKCPTLNLAKLSNFGINLNLS